MKLELWATTSSWSCPCHAVWWETLGSTRRKKVMRKASLCVYCSVTICVHMSERYACWREPAMWEVWLTLNSISVHFHNFLQKVSCVNFNAYRRQAVYWLLIVMLYPQVVYQHLSGPRPHVRTPTSMADAVETVTALKTHHVLIMVPLKTSFCPLFIGLLKVVYWAV